MNHDNETAPASSLEAKDRELFDRIAPSYFEKDLTESSRIARKRRLLKTSETCERSSLGDLLEVGCGGGFVAEYLKGEYATYCGVDYSENLIAFAVERHSDDNVEFHACNIKDFEQDRMFDVVLMVGVLHHLDDMQGILGQILARVRPGGLIVVNEPHPGNPLVTLLRKIRKKTDSNYSEDQVELSWDELKGVFEDAGLEDVRLKAQGIFSTPFAEVVLRPQGLFAPLAKVACLLDDLLEHLPTPILKFLTWNIVAVGRKPDPADTGKR